MNRIDALLEQACGAEFTAVTARIERRGCVVYERALGQTRADALARPVYADTLFDLASLTKLFVATLLWSGLRPERSHSTSRSSAYFPNGTAERTVRSPRECCSPIRRA